MRAVVVGGGSWGSTFAALLAGADDESAGDVEPEQDGAHDAEQSVELGRVVQLGAQVEDGEQVEPLDADCEQHRAGQQVLPADACVRESTRHRHPESEGDEDDGEGHQQAGDG